MPIVLDYIALVPGRAPVNVTAGSPSTTLNGLTAIGASTATLTSATGISPGMVLLIDTAGNSEVALVQSVAGNVVTFASTLQIAHASGVAVSVAVIPDGPIEHPGTVRSPYLAGG
jgi:hypothetical protein